MFFLMSSAGNLQQTKCLFAQGDRRHTCTCPHTYVMCIDKESHRQNPKNT